MTNVVEDGCTGHVAADPPVGPTVDDMATALAALSPFVLSEPPSDVTIDGFSGKHLELTVPDIAIQRSGDGNTFTDCTDGELWSYIGKPLSFANHSYSHPGQAEEFWLHARVGRDAQVARVVRSRPCRAPLDARLDRHRSLGQSGGRVVIERMSSGAHRGDGRPVTRPGTPGARPGAIGMDGCGLIQLSAIRVLCQANRGSGARSASSVGTAPA
jgi:hypothetical protein